MKLRLHNEFFAIYLDLCYNIQEFKGKEGKMWKKERY